MPVTRKSALLLLSSKKLGAQIFGRVSLFELFISVIDLINDYFLVAS